jgi:hypothetical protein
MIKKPKVTVEIHVPVTDLRAIEKVERDFPPFSTRYIEGSCRVFKNVYENSYEASKVLTYLHQALFRNINNDTDLVISEVRVKIHWEDLK